MNHLPLKPFRIWMRTYLLFMFLCFIVAPRTSAESLTSFTYPTLTGDVRSFDDQNPIWGPSDLVLSFERVYKSGRGGQDIYWYQPFFNKAVLPLAVQAGGRGFASYFSWVMSEKPQTKSTYHFVYTHLPHIYFGELTLQGSEGILNAEPKFNWGKGEPFIPGEKGGYFENKFADYSPPNRFVAYVSGLTGQGDIYIKSLSNEAKEWGGDYNVDMGFRVTKSEVLDLAPRWSPDGKHLVYSSDQEGNMDIFLLKDVLAPDGKRLNPESQTIPLTSSQLDETYPTWSPDGELIAFYSIGLESEAMSSIKKDGENPQIPPTPPLVSTGSTRRKRGSDSGGAGISDDTDVAPDDGIGQRIRSEKRSCDLWVVKPDGSKPIQVAKEVYRQLRRGPVWVPPLKNLKGRYLIYTSGTYDQIYVVNVDEAMASPGEAKPIPIEGLSGYQKHITDLDCTKLRSSSIALAYSALNPEGQKRIYVEIIEYTAPGTWRVTQSVLPE